MKNISFIVITYDPSFYAFLMLTIDQFLTIVRLPASRATASRGGAWHGGNGGSHGGGEQFTASPDPPISHRGGRISTQNLVNNGEN